MKKGTSQRRAVAAVAVTIFAISTGCAILDLKETEQKITLNDLPAAVKSLAEKETAGCRIKEVEKEMKGEKVIYSITYDQAGTTMELEYAADGTLISKEKE